METKLVGIVDTYSSVVGVVEESNMGVFEIFQGNVKTMFLRAQNVGCNADPLDLTSCSEIDVSLPNADGTFTHLTLTAAEVFVPTPKNLGKFQVALTSDISKLLNVGELQTFQVTFTIGGSILTIRFEQALSVFEVT